MASGGPGAVAGRGSPRSKEGDDRLEARIDVILLTLEPTRGNQMIKDIDRIYEDGTQTPACAVTRLARRTVFNSTPLKGSRNSARLYVMYRT
jgi:hypothetical protein